MYTWSQNLTDIDIKIPVPSTVKKSSDITIKILSNSLKVLLNKEPHPGEFFSLLLLVNQILTNSCFS